MKTLAYLDCPTGIAGDMCLGALVDLGLPLTYLTDHLNRLGIADEYRLQVDGVRSNGQAATRVTVALSEKGTTTEVEMGEHGRHLPEIEQCICQAQLPDRVTQWSLAIFRQLAQAEGAVHGISPEQVHFHEVGATDALVDIVGTCLGLDWLGVDGLYCSALPVGGGMVKAAHGWLPVPAPAVLKLLEMRQVPVYSNQIQRELVTPTGAAIATTLATAFGGPPPLTLQRVGLGAGKQSLPLPNILRLWVGEGDPPASGTIGRTVVDSRVATPTDSSPVPARTGEGHWHPHPPKGTGPKESGTEMGEGGAAYAQDSVMVLQTQMDDLNPQIIGYLFEGLFAAGALDVFTQAVSMKKSRPGLLLTVICPPDCAAACETLLFRETSTLGIRRTLQVRSVLHRQIEAVETPYGAIRVKVARPQAGGEIVNVQPEYEDCARIAAQTQLPWQQIHHLALWTWQAQLDRFSSGRLSSQSSVAP